MEALHCLRWQRLWQLLRDEIEVLGHRVKVSARAKAQGIDTKAALNNLMHNIGNPRM